MIYLFIPLIIKLSSIFIKFLESWVINILADFKIKGEVREDRVGIWVDCDGKEEKISAIGIKLKKWVSYHGIAVNIDPELSFFNNIIPCGIVDKKVTSLENEIGRKIAMEEVKNKLKTHLVYLFEMEII